MFVNDREIVEEHKRLREVSVVSKIIRLVYMGRSFVYKFSFQELIVGVNLFSSLITNYL